MRVSGLAATFLLGLAVVAASPAIAQKRYDPGASDSEIKVGHTNPYSGPASAYGQIGKTIAAYLNKVNAEGGINGRMINFISYDDAYSPPKTVEQARRLIESDEVLLLFQTLGTPSNTAIHKYMNSRKVPHLFLATGATKWADPRHFPWTMPFPPSYQSEARIYAKYLIEHHPGGRVGILYQNDDYGKDYLKGLKDGLAGKLQIVAEAPYETADTTVDTQIINLKAAGADIFFNVSTPKFAAQAIRRVAEIGWKPIHIINNVAVSVGSVLQPAGLDNAKGLLSTTYLKDPTDPSWQDDPAVKTWSAFMDKYYPDGDRRNNYTVYGYVATQLLVQVLRQCGDDLTRANVMRQAAGIRDLQLDMMLPGIRFNTGSNDYQPIEQLQMMRFDGARWERFGPVISSDTGS
jgi:branched-chain amino acid transport system substrate-binding protein